MNSNSTENWRRESPKQLPENWRRESPKQLPEKSSKNWRKESPKESPKDCGFCHAQVCSFKIDCRFFMRGNCRLYKGCTCLSASVCQPSASGGSAVNKQPVPDPVPDTEIVSTKVDASSDDLDANLNETFLKINASIERGERFTRNFNEDDRFFLSNRENNEMIAQFLMNLCLDLNKKIRSGKENLETCKKIMSPAEYIFSSGSTALHVAAWVGNKELAYLLVKFGFGKYQNNKKKFSPCDIFQVRHRIDITYIEEEYEMDFF
jgi:hypothetical protein